MPRRSLTFLVVVGLLGIAIAFNANTLDPFIYNEKVRLLAPSGLKNSALGGLTIMALLLALVVQPLVGQLSDRTHSRWGARIPFLAMGAAGISVSLALVVLADNFWLLAVAAMLTSAFANTNQAAWQALIPDYVPLFQQGRAAGIKTVLELSGSLGGVAVAGLFLARGVLWAPPLLTALLFWLTLVVTTVFLLKQAPTAVKTAPPTQTQAQSALWPVIRQAPSAFWWWTLNRVLFWAAAISIRTFLLNYLEDVFGLTPTDAQAVSSRIIVILGLGIFLLAVPSGAIADRVGRRPVLIVAGLMAASGTIIAISRWDIPTLYLAGSLIAIGAGIFASASWSLATNLAPADQGALYLGLANAATVIGSISGRIGGVLIDGINRIFDTETTGYLVVFGLAALLFAFSSLAAQKIPEPDKSASTNLLP